VVSLQITQTNVRTPEAKCWRVSRHGCLCVKHAVVTQA